QRVRARIAGNERVPPRRARSPSRRSPVAPTLHVGSRPSSTTFRLHSTDAEAARLRRFFMWTRRVSGMAYVKPDTVVEQMIQVGAHKSRLPVRDLLVRGFLAGALLGFATTLAFTAS